MKYLIVLLVVVVGLWLLVGRNRKVGGAAAPGRKPAAKPLGADPMVACLQCGMHVPQKEAVFDAAGRPYCGEPHLRLGPR